MVNLLKNIHSTCSYLGLIGTRISGLLNSSVGLDPVAILAVLRHHVQVELVARLEVTLERPRQLDVVHFGATFEILLK